MYNVCMCESKLMRKLNTILCKFHVRFMALAPSKKA